MLFLTRIFLIVVTASFAVGAPLNAAGGDKRQNTTRHGLKAIPRNAARATNARLDTIAGEGMRWNSTDTKKHCGPHARLCS